MSPVRMPIVVVAVVVALGAACGSGGSEFSPCGVADSGTGETPVCGEGLFCVCATGTCAEEWTECTTGYRFVGGDRLCISPAQRVAVIRSDPADHAACGGGGDADADGAGDAEAEAEAAEADDGPPDEAHDGSGIIELSVFSGEEIYRTPFDRRSVSRTLTFPVPRPYSDITLEFRLRSGCPSLCERSPRTVSVTLGLDDTTTVEVFRAVTPFGADRTWLADVTDLAEWFGGERTVTASIDTVEGAWEIDLRVLFTPGTPPRDVLALIPIEYDPAVSSATDLPERRISIPSGAASAVLLWRATGHDEDGTGCDETCPKHFLASVDGTDRIDVVPWRTDCADFAAANPGTDPLIVGMERSGWCPADVVPAASVDATAWLPSGNHTFDARIEGVEAAGGRWRVSLDLVLYR